MYLHQMEGDVLEWLDTWRYLPIESILTLCQVNQRMAQACQRPTMWRYLLRRDFPFRVIQIPPDADPRERYMYYYRLVHLFNFTVLTEYAIDMIQKFLPQNLWEVWLSLYGLVNPGNTKFLDTSRIISLLHEITAPSWTDPETNEDKQFEQIVPGANVLIDMVEREDIDVMELEHYVNGLVAKDLGESPRAAALRLQQSACQHFGQVPLLIFIQRRPYVAPHNVEVLQRIHFEVDQHGFPECWNRLNDYIDQVYKSYLS